MNKILLSILILAVAISMMSFIKRVLVKRVAYRRDAKHANTFLGIVFSIMQYLVIIVSALVILKINGVDVTGILASIGIVATIIGLALQDTIKDFFAGINIYNNNFYKVGDVVKYNGELCEVKYFNASITKFSSVGTNSTYTVNNSNISAIEKVKDKAAVGFVFDYNDDDVVVNNVLNKVVERAKVEVEDITDLKNAGIVDINDAGLKYVIAYSCPPLKQAGRKGQLIKICWEEFKKAGIHPNENSEVKVQMVAKKYAGHNE